VSGDRQGVPPKKSDFPFGNLAISAPSRKSWGPAGRQPLGLAHTQVGCPPSFAHTDVSVTTEADQRGLNHERQRASHAVRRLAFEAPGAKRVARDGSAGTPALICSRLGA